MRRFTLTLAATAAALVLSAAARAEAPMEADQTGAGQDRLLIVSANSGRVVYDDGRDDLYCVTARYTVGYDDYGRPIRRRSMNCR